MATASTESRITYIDGDQGVLLYRGYPIEQLAAQSSFIEVAYLLNNGELPDQKQLADFSVSIQRHTMINESLLRFYNGFHYDAHPMAQVSAVVASMAGFYHDSLDIHNPRHREIFAHRIIAKMPTISAAAATVRCSCWGSRERSGAPSWWPCGARTWPRTPRGWS